MTKVLDHGYVRLQNIAGPVRRKNTAFDADDTDPAIAARLSFDQVNLTRSREADLRLCAYLLKNRHTSPFEMIDIWLEMKLPIFVARQFVRHRTTSLNEVSARYVQLPEEWYIPSLDSITIKSASNKQGRQVPGKTKPHWAARLFRSTLNLSCWLDYKLYQFFLRIGIPPEIARTFLHTTHYTKWLWKQDLHNMMHFLNLRTDSHAQWEAQQYANAIVEILKRYLPKTMRLWAEQNGR
jgi:thymidylate synthase (FAD)